jgi:hypothetical protein
MARAIAVSALRTWFIFNTLARESVLHLGGGKSSGSRRTIPLAKTKCAKGATATRWFSLIRTLTVGSGITPNPPVNGLDRVADFNCRFEITSTPKNNKAIITPGNNDP